MYQIIEYNGKLLDDLFHQVLLILSDIWALKNTAEKQSLQQNI